MTKESLGTFIMSRLDERRKTAQNSKDILGGLLGKLHGVEEGSYAMLDEVYDGILARLCDIAKAEIPLSMAIFKREGQEPQDVLYTTKDVPDMLNSMYKEAIPKRKAEIVEELDVIAEKLSLYTNTLDKLVVVAGLASIVIQSPLVSSVILPPMTPEFDPDIEEAYEDIDLVDAMEYSIMFARNIMECPPLRVVGLLLMWMLHISKEELDAGIENSMETLEDHPMKTPLREFVDIYYAAMGHSPASEGTLILQIYNIFYSELMMKNIFSMDGLLGRVMEKIVESVKGRSPMKSDLDDEVHEHFVGRGGSEGPPIVH